MSRPDISLELVDGLQRLSALLGSDNVLEETLQTVVDLSVATLPGCDSAGVTVRAHGRDTTAAATDAYTLEIDKIQYSNDEGPCVSSLEESVVKQIDAVSEESRWPDFCKQAADKGLKSVLSLPLINNEPLGSLNLYARTERAFDQKMVDIAQIFAKQASIALENARTYAEARLLAAQLTEALKSRDAIGQAKGILMEREGVSDDEAFEMLKTISQNANVKLRDIAQRLIDEKQRSAEQAGRGPTEPIASS
ncbi:MAG: hypothetical protein QOF16_379 [Actinomycetota bacterium]|nr:hypothetical protein [Actinomycetota bacterium]MEA2486725.1 hypothetical protein [Actinomycetota bacterium]